MLLDLKIIIVYDFVIFKSSDKQMELEKELTLMIVTKRFIISR